MEINDPTTLPRQCKNGMIVEVINSSDSQEDDYFLKFVGDAGNDGPGRWEETVGPNVATSFDAAPCLTLFNVNLTVHFTVGTYTWATRQVGDDDTNPFPVFYLSSC